MTGRAAETQITNPAKAVQHTKETARASDLESGSSRSVSLATACSDLTQAICLIQRSSVFWKCGIALEIEARRTGQPSWKTEIDPAATVR